MLVRAETRQLRRQRTETGKEMQVVPSEWESLPDDLESHQTSGKSKLASVVPEIASAGTRTALDDNDHVSNAKNAVGSTNLNKNRNSWIGAAHNEKQLQSSMIQEMSRMQRGVQSTAFLALSSIVILFNAVIIGVEATVNFEKAEEDKSQVWFWLEIAFLIWYSFELVIRFMADGPHMIHDHWIQFDLMILLLACVDLCVLVQTDQSGGEISSLANSLRITRLLKLARIVRLVRLFKELSLLVESIGGALKTLVWTFLLLTILIYIFGLLFFDTIGRNMKEERYRERFNTLPAAMLSLFQIMTLDGWSDLAFAVWKDGEVYYMVVMIIVFIVICSFAVLNTVMAVIVEHTLESGMDRQDQMVKKAQQNLQKSSTEFLEVFLKNDEDRSGTLTKTEFIAAIHNQKTRSLLQKMGAGEDFAFINDQEIGALFDMIDIDGSGELLPQEFVNGLLHMRGPARARSIFELHCEMQARSNRAEEIHDALSRKMDAMGKQMQDLLRGRSERAEEIQQILTNRLDKMNEDIQMALKGNAANAKEIEDLQHQGSSSHQSFPYHESSSPYHEPKITIEDLQKGFAADQEYA